METLISLFCYYEKEFFDMNTWIAAKDLMKSYYLKKGNLYRYTKRVFKIFNNKNTGEYYGLYVQSDTLLLSDIFENFGDKCIEINELDPAHFLSALKLPWEACLKKTEIRLELLTDIDMLLMVEKGTKGGKCHAIRRYAKENNNYIKNYNKDKESACIQYLDTNNLNWMDNVSKITCREFEWEEDMLIKN